MHHLLIYTVIAFNLMKQLIQNYRTGEIGIYEVPPPICKEEGVLIETTASLISAGTEKMIIDLAKKSLLGKAKERPDLVKEVLRKMQKEGIKDTLKKVFAKLDTPIPLGYSCAGRVIEVGRKVQGISIGDRVACGGAGYANHAEINYVPKNLFVKIPENVEDIEASFVTVGAIALQGVRQANPRIGEKVAVIGLGLLGQITLQILKANGCMVIGSDLDPWKLELAKELGIDEISYPDELVEKATEFSDGYGVDSVIITASTSSEKPIIDAGEISRTRGTIVVVGMLPINIPRNLYYKKELTLKLSMAYGPGRYDPNYEEKGIDYPYDLVRWTENRNFQAFLELLSQKKVLPKKLITHIFSFDEAIKAYQLLEGKTKEKYLGIVLTYHKSKGKSPNIIQITEKIPKESKIGIGLIGAGNFTRSIILPTLKKIKEIRLVGVATSTGISSYTVGKKYRIEYITTEEKEIWKNPQIHAVIIATRHNDHKDKVLKAIENKKHCFIEKPLAIKEEELEEIREKYTGERILQVGFNRRFSPFIKKIKEEVKNKPISILYRIYAGVIPLDHWIQDPDIGGGRIVGEVCHFVDLCSYLAGSLVKSVYASVVKKSSKHIPDEDNVNILLEFANGSTASIHYFAYGDKALSKEYIEVFGENIAFQLQNFKELLIYKNGKKKKIKKISQEKGFLEELQAFIEGIQKGKNPIPFESLYNTTKTTFKILESIRKRQRIDVI